MTKKIDLKLEFSVMVPDDIPANTEGVMQRFLEEYRDGRQPFVIEAVQVAVGRLYDRILAEAIEEQEFVKFGNTMVDSVLCACGHPKTDHLYKVAVFSNESICGKCNVLPCQRYRPGFSTTKAVLAAHERTQNLFEAMASVLPSKATIRISFVDTKQEDVQP